MEYYNAVNLFTDLLRESGYDVYGFTNPLVLLDYIHHHNNQFRLVLIDCQNASTHRM